MTDNEITREKTFSEELPHFKERIEEVFDNYNNPNSNEDPLYICVLRDSKHIVRKAEEEIARQQTEIKRLQKEVNLVSIQFQDEQERAEEYRLKIENLQNIIFNQQIEISAKIEKQIKTEAYKEFADMVKKNIKEVWNYDNGTCSCVLVLTKDIDKILKEMISEEE